GERSGASTKFSVTTSERRRSSVVDLHHPLVHSAPMDPAPHSMLSHHSLRARLAILAAAILFSTGGAAIKATSLTGWQVASFRSPAAAIAVLAMLPAARRGWGLAPWIVGAAYAATMILFVLANKLTTAAATIFLQATAPLYLVLIGPLLLKEPVRRRDAVFMVAVASGLALFFVGV